MRAIYLDCFSGISGNMLLGAFLQAGVPREYLERELNRISIPEPYSLQVSQVFKNGIQAVYADVELFPHSHEQEVHHHEADHEETCSDDMHHHHGHRSMHDIRRMLETSELSPAVKARALHIFEVLAAAEGKVHGRPKEEVTFHEVGAVDSIVDIVGAAICMEYMNIEKVFVSGVNTGSGFVHCAHGKMMVPAPATAELLKGFPTFRRGAEKELTTPTGAAVIHAMAEYREGLPDGFSVDKIAYGAGTWDLEIPNVLRMYLGAWTRTQNRQKYLLETNIDDMNPQIYGYLYDLLLSEGALDVWTTPIFMKKNRPANMLSVLTDEEHRARCEEILLTESTTIGLRIVPVESRTEAERKTETVKTGYGEISCKVSSYRGRVVTVSAEYEECRGIALERGIPLKQVQQEAVSAWYREHSHTEGES